MNPKFLSLFLIAASFSAFASTGAAKPEDNASNAELHKKMKAHSHMEEKVAPAPAKAAEQERGNRSKVEQDKTKHLHARDGK